MVKIVDGQQPARARKQIHFQGRRKLRALWQVSLCNLLVLVPGARGPSASGKQYNSAAGGESSRSRSAGEGRRVTTAASESRAATRELFQSRAARGAESRVASRAAPVGLALRPPPPPRAPTWLRRQGRRHCYKRHMCALHATGSPRLPTDDYFLLDLH